jgi:hypothetical protein
MGIHQLEEMVEPALANTRNVPRISGATQKTGSFRSEVLSHV